ncbi:MAG TPA: ABC transporter ATP-binding protein, partial [Kutzneria sp.]|nr:ABC transporter ATP-binding protein [Kutzneria sp.]
EGEGAQAGDLADLAADAGSAGVPDSGNQVVTRLSAASTVAEGRPLKLWFDADKVQLFDPASGANLTYMAD